ncbi:MAG: CBS domain-containing protein, partial [Bacteroidia bacterium]|nr:CBS domain-containing protein [Bacteroidia bacterium]
GQSLEMLVKELDRHQVDFFHIDSKDNAAVFADIHSIRDWSQTPVDLHLITANPFLYLEHLREDRVELVTYQYELLENMELPILNQTETGIAIVSDTPLSALDVVVEQVDFVLFMTTTPGESGGQFRRENFQRIRDFRRRHPQVRVHVDGGVNDEVSFILRNLGVYSAVSGSYLLNGESISASLHSLKVADTNSHYRVEDFMIGLIETPLLPISETHLISVLQTIEDFGLGLAIVTHGDGRLAGISTNADVRRALLKHPQNLHQVPPEELLNTSPLVAYADETVAELLQKVKQTSFPVSYLPVVDRQEKVVGTLTFANLVKGEM